MMEVFSALYQHLLVLKGVNNGLVGDDDLSILMEKYRIEKEQRPALMDYIKERNLTILTGTQKEELMDQPDSSATLAVEADDDHVDEKLDQVLNSYMSKAVETKWLDCLDELKDPTTKDVIILKFAGFTAENIAYQLSIDVAEVHACETAILHHYQRIKRWVIHQRRMLARRRLDSDFPDES